MTDNQNSQKMLVDCTYIVDTELSVDPYDSMIDLFAVICMRNNRMKKLPPELPIPFRMVHKQRIKLNRLGS